MIDAESGDINSLIQFPGNSDLEIFFRICVGCVNSRMFCTQSRKIHSLDSFSFISFFGVQRRPWDWYSKMWNFIVNLLVSMISLPGDAYSPKRPRKCLKTNFRFLLPVLWSSIIWAIQIQVSFPEVENPKNPGQMRWFWTDLTSDDSKGVSLKWTKCIDHRINLFIKY